MIFRTKLAGKLHGLRVTGAQLYYSGSIEIPASLCLRCDLQEGDQVAVYNFMSGARYETYVLPGEERKIVVNGPSARLSQAGDCLVIAQYVLTDEPIKPQVLFFNEENVLVDREAVFSNHV